MPRRARGPAAALSLVLLTAACSSVAGDPDPAVLPRTTTVYVVGRDWHTEIGLRAEDMKGPLAPLRARFPGVRTVLFGFGDRQYLTARRTDFGDMAIAAFPGPAAMLVTGLHTTPMAAFGAANVTEVPLTLAGLQRLSGFLWHAFEADAAGRPVPLGDGPYAGSLFFASAETYSLAHNCNTWTAEALQTGGTVVRATGVLFAGQVMERARTAALSADGEALRVQPPAKAPLEASAPTDSAVGPNH